MKLLSVQLSAADEPLETRLSHVHAILDRAGQLGAELVLLPELTLPGYGAGSRLQSDALTPDSDALRQLQARCEDAQTALLIGFSESEDGFFYNAALLLRPSSKPQIYRKTCLYGDYERRYFSAAPADTFIFEWAGLRCGVLICYDVEFPENTRRLAHAGVQLILVPTALDAGDSGEFISRQLVPVRAFENQLFVAYCNWAGSDAKGRYQGNSSIVAPDGYLLASANTEDEAELLVRIDPAEFAGDLENDYLADCRLYGVGFSEGF